NLAANHRDIGDVYVRRGDLTSGYAEYDIAILLQKRLIARDPDNAIWQFSLASLYANLGGILTQQGDLAGALERYRMAYAIRQKLALADPTNPARQNRLAKAAILVADLLEAQKQNLDEAVRLYSEAIEIQDEVRPQQDRDVFHSYI